MTVNFLAGQRPSSQMAQAVTILRMESVKAENSAWGWPSKHLRMRAPETEVSGQQTGRKFYLLEKNYLFETNMESQN